MCLIVPISLGKSCLHFSVYPDTVILFRLGIPLFFSGPTFLDSLCLFSDLPSE